MLVVYRISGNPDTRLTVRHCSDTFRHSKLAIQTVETREACLSSVNRVKLRHFDTSDTSDTACNARFTTQEPKNAHCQVGNAANGLTWGF